MSIFKDLPPCWLETLLPFIQSEKGKRIEVFTDSLDFKEVYPPRHLIFKAFNECPFEKTKVVILGQDPYHGEGQAHGLAFSVPKGVKLPPSLRNIFKEREEDLGVPFSDSGDLSSWAQEGVLLLNTVLTVKKSEAQSHQKQGWEDFTDQVIRALSEKRENLVFILWGGPAKKKRKLIDEKKHKVITSAHPSPLSSYRGFFGSKPFSQANNFLKTKGITPPSWK